MVGYDDLLSEVVEAIANSRAELVSRTNGLAVELYWQIGQSILARQEKNVGYGGAVVEQLAADLSARYTGQRAWSPRNL